MLKNETHYLQKMNWSATLLSAYLPIRFSWEATGEYRDHPITSVTNQQFIIRDAVACIPVQDKEAIKPLVLKPANAIQRSVNDCPLAALDTLVLRTVPKIMNSAEFKSLFSDAINDNPGLIAAVTAFVKSQ